MNLTFKEVKSKSDLKRFVKFPFKIYSGNDCWVPPLIIDELKTLDPKVNPAFDFCEAKYWIAYIKNQPVGRIAGIINNSANKKFNEKVIRFGWIDFIDDKNVSNGLIKKVSEWGKEKGMDLIEGPLGFCDMDPEGLLIEGFDELSTMATIYNHSYYKDHFEDSKFNKSTDWIEFELYPPNPPSEKVERISKISLERYKLHIFQPKTRKELSNYFYELFDVLNESFEGLYGFVKLNEKQKKFLIKQYFGLVKVEYLPIILDQDNRIAGFGVTFPSFSRALQKSKGKIFPLGWYHILKAFSKPDKLDLYLIGIRKDMQDKGINAIIMNEINKVCNQKNIINVESNIELEDNKKVQNQWKFYDKRQHKKRRCYKRKI